MTHLVERQTSVTKQAPEGGHDGPPMDLEAIGAMLREARQKQGRALADLVAETKIRERYLRALEEGDASVFPGVVYLKGFLRAYATALGLDGAALAAQLRLEAGPVTAEAPQADRVPAGPDLKRLPQARRPRGRAVSYLVALLVLAAAAVVWAWSAGLIPPAVDLAAEGPDAGVEAPPAEAPGAEQAPATEPPAQPRPPAPAPPAEVTVTRQDGPEGLVTFLVGDSRLEVEILARWDRCWVEVSIGGQVVFSGILERGQRRVVEAEREIRLVVGNTPALEFTANGVELGIISPVGPTRIVFTATRTP